jgi:hypothetical protein
MTIRSYAYVYFETFENKDVELFHLRIHIDHGNVRPRGQC